MAGVSTKEIKTRIRSMESTKQITKAMEMVAASKLRKAQNQVLAARPYFQTLRQTIGDIVANNQDFTSPYLQSRPVEKTAYVVIAGDRGLAGGYNSNILKAVMAEIEGKEATVLPVGKKAVDYFKSHKISLMSETYCDAEDMTLGDCFTAAKTLCRSFLAGEFDEIVVAYTDFVSVLSQVPRTMRLLPLACPREGTGADDIIYEPNSETVFATIIPEYLGGVLYGALCESRAAEQAARRTAMDNATQNANEMIDNLSLQFNRARQAAITSEIIDIVAGSNL
ncbi:MAG: ATP synthase F1 subunit gamma [Oscillospiraceae bacterium]|nr:ATP synthase F1 subunit gamma [Oscillospiraceae bacterium]